MTTKAFSSARRPDDDDDCISPDEVPQYSENGVKSYTNGSTPKFQETALPEEEAVVFKPGTLLNLEDGGVAAASQRDELDAILGPRKEF